MTGRKKEGKRKNTEIEKNKKEWNKVIKDGKRCKKKREKTTRKELYKETMYRAVQVWESRVGREIIRCPKETGQER